MGWIGLIIYALIVISSIGAWINTKIILEELSEIKKKLGIEEEKSTFSLKTDIDNSIEDKQDRQ